MDDALFARMNVKQTHAKLFTVLPQGLDLVRRNGIRDWETAIRGGYVMIDSGYCQFGPAHSSTGLSQAIECLWRCHLVNEVEIDVEKSWLTLRLPYNMSIPEFIEES
jgi:hypothetical protein